MRVSFSGRMTASQAVNGSSIPPTRTIKKSPIGDFFVVRVEQANCLACVGNRKPEHVALRQRGGVEGT